MIVDSGQWTLDSDCELRIVGTELSVMWHHGGVQTRGSAETHPVQYRLELLQVWTRKLDLSRWSGLLLSYGYIHPCHSVARKDWSRRGRPGRNISETYSHIFLALTKLLRVAKVRPWQWTDLLVITCSSKYSTVVCCQVVLKCYQNYPKLYKRLGPTSKNGGLENFSLKVQSMKFLLEDLLTSHLRLSLPRKEF